MLFGWILNIDDAEGFPEISDRDHNKSIERVALWIRNQGGLSLLIQLIDNINTCSRGQSNGIKYQNELIPKWTTPM